MAKKNSELAKLVGRVKELERVVEILKENSPCPESDTLVHKYKWFRNRSGDQCIRCAVCRASRTIWLPDPSRREDEEDE